MKSPIKHLVLGSGGLRGLCIIGALKKISDKLKINNKPFIKSIPSLKSITGTSIGSVIACLLCLNYSIEEIMILVLNIKWTQAMKSSGIQNFMSGFGMINRETIDIEVQSIIYNKLGVNSINFRDLYKLSGIQLNIIATNLTKNTMVTFNYLNTPDIDITPAMFASAAIPFIFEPVQINNETYIDGALMSSLPIDVALAYDQEQKETDVLLGIDLSSGINDATDRSNMSLLENYIYNIMVTVFKRVCSTNKYDNLHNIKIYQKVIQSKYNLADMLFEKEDIHCLFNEGFACNLDDLFD